MKSQREILVRPILTEKMLKMQEAERKYGFVVNIEANKIEIKKNRRMKSKIEQSGFHGLLPEAILKL